jgi:MOSC domain-containing protein YiiM
MPHRLSPLFSWLADWRPDELRGTLTDIYVATSAGAPMQRVAGIRAIAGAGLEGDRYALGSGHWRRTDACEVTLVDAADLERAQRRSGIAFATGEHRRNLVVRGIPLDAYRNRRVRIGEVLLEFHRLRPPCGYLDRLLQRGAGKALGKGAGIGLRVIEGGVLRAGDRVQVLERGGEPA